MLSPISSQGAEGSCVGFATTYYHATHEIGLLNGYNNKTSSANVLSPKWTYNMINGGGDSGSWPPIAYTLLAQNGATSIANFPYVVGDLLSWDLNTQDWIGAMSNRMGPSYTVNIGGDSSDFSAIKQLLNNGHVVTVCTYAYSWQITKILQAPNGAADNRFVGQSAISWMNGSSGGHNVTIVGYNDDIWIDVNGNGQIDPGEKGAFLVANQWGSNWGNNGFIWVSYDAFLKKSAVPNGPSTGRVAFASLMSNLAVAAVPKSAHYKPQLVAKFGLTAAIRSQIEISAGVSSTTSTTPAKTLQSGALNHQGGAFGFDGKNQKESATFALDLTDLVDTTPSNTNNRFYLIVNDNASGNPTQIDSFSLIDYAHNQTTNGVNFPQVVDANTLNVFVDNNVTPPPQPPSPSPSPSPSPTLLPIVFITSPLDHSTVSCSLPVSVSVTGNSLPISMVALYLDHFQILVDQEAPYTFLLDTTKLTNGYHQLLAVAVDTDGNVGKANVAINVKNGCP